MTSTGEGPLIRPGMWLRRDGHYFYYRGQADDGTPRLIPMTRPPHGRRVLVMDDPSGKPRVEKLPSHWSPGTVFFTGLAALAAVVVPLMLSGQDPILARIATPVVVGVLTLIAILVHTAHLHPHDAQSLAEAQQDAYEAQLGADANAMAAAARRQGQALAQLGQWQAAQWAQQASVNQALNPGQDVYRPYGQSPPL